MKTSRKRLLCLILCLLMILSCVPIVGAEEGASGSDDALRLVPHSRLSLEQSLEFIRDDELVEITPNNIRLRKKILGKEERMKAESKKK